MQNENPVSAEQNSMNLDSLGRHLTQIGVYGGNIDSKTALALARLAAECRVYSAYRDEEILGSDQPILMEVRAALDAEELDLGDDLEDEDEIDAAQQPSVDEVANRICEDLLTDGILIL
jgi:hypothetical protein